MSKLIRVSDDVWEKLNSKALEHNLSIGRMVESLVNGGTTPDPTQDLVDKLDYEAEHPEVSLSPEDRELFEQLEPGELPECCQEYYTSGEKCRHWHKEYVNYYGKRVIGYRNTLTGGTNYDYQTLYQQ